MNGQPLTSRQQRTVFARDNYRCWYCGLNLLNLVCDSMGVCNLVSSCNECNALKGAMTLEEYREAIGKRHGLPSVIFFGEGERNIDRLCLYRNPEHLRAEYPPSLLQIGGDGRSFDVLSGNHLQQARSASGLYITKKKARGA